LDGISSFAVFKNGLQLDYKGPVALRMEPKLDAYLKFEAMQTLSVIVDLTLAFDIPAEGIYHVQMIANVVDHGEESEILTRPFSNSSSIIVESNSLSIQVRMISSVVVRSPISPLANTFEQCTNPQINTISGAWTQFGVACTMAADRVTQNPQNAALYRTWFGAYLASRFTTVQSCLNNLRSDSRGNGHKFRCAAPLCSGGVIAYVYGNDPSTIYICSGYFNLSPRDHIFVITHEVAHFQVICGAGDVVYGRSGSQNLANTDPARAVRNSDNFRYYSEDVYYG